MLINIVYILYPWARIYRITYQQTLTDAAHNEIILWRLRFLVLSSGFFGAFVNCSSAAGTDAGAAAAGAATTVTTAGLLTAAIAGVVAAGADDDDTDDNGDDAAADNHNFDASASHCSPNFKRY